MVQQDLPSLPLRIIARLDVKKPNVVKGIHLEGLRIIGSPEQLAIKYQDQGIDELIFIDSVASLYQRNTVFDVIENVAENLRIPFTVGGGVKTIEHINKLLYKGADKVLMNTGAIMHPEIVEQAARNFGSQCVVVSIEAKKVSQGKWIAYTDNGRENTGLDVIEWVKKVEQLGAGEIFLTSIDQDGTQKGFDINLCTKVTNMVNLPVILSGGAGVKQHIIEVLKSCDSDGIAIGSMLHYNKNTVGEIKNFLSANDISVRPVASL